MNIISALDAARMASRVRHRSVRTVALPLTRARRRRPARPQTAPAPISFPSRTLSGPSRGYDDIFGAPAAPGCVLARLCGRATPRSLRPCHVSTGDHSRCRRTYESDRSVAPRANTVAFEALLSGAGLCPRILV